MNLREAAQQALEALELAGMSHDVMLMSDPPQDAWKARGVSWKLAQAMTALRTALHSADMATSQESQQVEPVAWLQIGVGDHEGTVIATTTKPKTWNPAWWRFEPLYTAPPKREPLTIHQLNGIEMRMRVYSDGDRYDLSLHEFARAIERAHGIGGEE